jgi:hypothetical protein
MTGLDPSKAAAFYRDDASFVSAAATTTATGIRDLLPGAPRGPRSAPAAPGAAARVVAARGSGARTGRPLEPHD